MNRLINTAVAITAMLMLLQKGGFAQSSASQSAKIVSVQIKTSIAQAEAAATLENILAEASTSKGKVPLDLYPPGYLDLLAKTADGSLPASQMTAFYDSNNNSPMDDGQTPSTTSGVCVTGLTAPDGSTAWVWYLVDTNGEASWPSWNWTDSFSVQYGQKVRCLWNYSALSLTNYWWPSVLISAWKTNGIDGYVTNTSICWMAPGQQYAEWTVVSNTLSYGIFLPLVFVCGSDTNWPNNIPGGDDPPITVDTNGTVGSNPNYPPSTNGMPFGYCPTWFDVTNGLIPPMPPDVFPPVPPGWPPHNGGPATGDSQAMRLLNNDNLGDSNQDVLVSLIYRAVPGSLTHVQATTNLADPGSWMTVTNIVTSPEALTEVFIDYGSAGPPNIQFYRLINDWPSTNK